MKKITVFDVTLKELINNRQTNLLFREKTAIASCISSLGIDGIEFAPVKNLREDSIVCGTISSNLKNCEVIIPGGFSKESISEAFSCIEKAEKPRIQIELPVSTVQMEYMYHLKSDKMLEKIKELVGYAKTLCGSVEFLAADASRAEKDFLISALKVAEESGADIITIADDAGVLLPDEFAELVNVAKNAVKSRIFVKTSDKISMAVACAFRAIAAGADGVKASLFGEDILTTGKLSDAVSERESSLGATVNINRTRIHTGVSELLKSVNKGEYKSEKSNSFKDEIILDSDSTLSQVCDATKALGYNLSDEDNGLVFKFLSSVCEKKGSVGADELEAIIASYAMQAPSTYHLENYTTSCGNLISSMTQIKLKKDDEIILGVSVGDRPIDSAFRAIEDSIGCHYEVDDFTIQSVTEGKEALGSAVVRLRNNGKLYSGNGISSDIVGASIRAYINALNKIVYEEE